MLDGTHVDHIVRRGTAYTNTATPTAIHTIDLVGKPNCMVFVRAYAHGTRSDGAKVFAQSRQAIGLLIGSSLTITDEDAFGNALDVGTSGYAVAIATGGSTFLNLQVTGSTDGVRWHFRIEVDCTSVTPTFHSLISSVSVLLAVQADIGITLNTGNVSQWNDLSGNGNNLTQATGTNQPAFQTNALNGRPSILFDGVDNWMSSAGPDLPAPGTTPTWWWFILRQKSWTNGEAPMKAIGASAMVLQQSGSSPAMTMNNTNNVNSNTGAAIDAWVRGELLYTNSASDYLKLGSTSAAGANAGNTNPTAGIYLGRDNAGSTFSHFELAALIICNGDPTPTEKSNLSLAATAAFGASVAV